ncbi:MAG: putative sugar nucleotidyl transferase [Cytophagales bacterium]|nr:putative sugar nucleotidyl transferase [Cytophagales bacterium]
MQITLFDHPEDHQNLLPVTYLKSISDIRIGIFTIKEKWEKHLNQSVDALVVAYQQGKYPVSRDFELLIRSNVLPDGELIHAINALSIGEKLVQENLIIAARVGASFDPSDLNFETLNSVSYGGKVSVIRRSWDIFQHNGVAITADFQLLDRSASGTISDPHTITYGSEIYIEAGASIRAATLNSETGPIYIGNNAEIQEGAMIRGPFALGDHSVVNMGAKLRGGVTLGPYCKIGGEASYCVMQGYSNKGHDGYLGSSVIGEWCNLGADTNNSNLKNNYENVKMWDYAQRRFIDTGLQFCGLIMGDHSKSAINTMFNTGTTIGISANIFGAGFPRNIIPSFSWGGAAKTIPYRLDKALETMERVMARREKTLTDVDKAMMTHIFDQTAHMRP